MWNETSRSTLDGCIEAKVREEMEKYSSITQNDPAERIFLRHFYELAEMFSQFHESLKTGGHSDEKTSPSEQEVKDLWQRFMKTLDKIEGLERRPSQTQFFERGPAVKLFSILPLPSWLRSFLLWLSSTKFTVGAVAVILQEDEVLLFHHTYRPNEPWGLPGGALKKLEGPEYALQRELKEEANIDVLVSRLLAIDNSSPRLIDFVFECVLRDPWSRIQFSPEIDEAKWCSLSKLPDDMLERHREILRRIRPILTGKQTLSGPVINIKGTLFFP